MIKEFWFDMDHTLMDNDCDVSWKEFLVKHGVAGREALAVADAFFADYNRGEMDHEAFIRFQLKEFAGRTPEEMGDLAWRHFEEYVKPKVYKKALALVEELRRQGVRTGILTATNTFIARPVAELFGVDGLLGTELELVDGRFTGRYVPPFGGSEGKVTIMAAYAGQAGLKMEEIAYFGDSINDRYILEAVGRATAVNPSAALAELASEKGWDIISFKE